MGPLSTNAAVAALRRLRAAAGAVACADAACACHGAIPDAAGRARAAAAHVVTANVSIVFIVRALLSSPRANLNMGSRAQIEVKGSSRRRQPIFDLRVLPDIPAWV